MRANSLSYLYHLSPRPPPDFNFFHCYEKKKDFLAISTAVSLLMSPGGIVFSVQCDEPVLRGHSAMWWVTSFAYLPMFPFQLFRFFLVCVLPLDCNGYSYPSSEAFLPLKWLGLIRALKLAQLFLLTKSLCFSKSSHVGYG